ncbi:MAG: DMT family transporter [Rhodocyclaceae bacterium]|nr:DMT family transporter [Rhodocyclaceae bacterium]
MEALLHADHRRRLPAEALLLLVAAIWGSSYGAARTALDHFPVLGFLALRFGITALLLAPRLVVLPPEARRASVSAAWPLGLLLLAIFLAETWGVLLAGAVGTAFLISTCTVFTPLVAWGLLGRRPAAGTGWAVSLSLCGALLLAGGPVDVRSGGAALVLLAALLRAVMVCASHRRLAPASVDPLAVTAVQAAVVAGGCLVLAAVRGEVGDPLPTAPAFWGATLYLVLFATILAFQVQNVAVRRCDPTRVGLLLGSEPLFGALVGWLWLGEQPGVAGWLGGAMIVLGSALALWPARRAQVP